MALAIASKQKTAPAAGFWSLRIWQNLPYPLSIGLLRFARIEHKCVSGSKDGSSKTKPGLPAGSPGFLQGCE
jgi:hypothetical protein